MINNFECQECGSSQITNMDGFFVCQGCGLTINDPVLQYDIGCFQTDKKGNSIQTHALLLNSSQIGNESERKFRKSHTNFTRLNKINRSISVGKKFQARGIFKTLFEQSGMAVNIDLYMDSFNKIFPKIKKHSKSRNLRLFCTTLYYVVMKYQGKNISLKSLLAGQNIDLREFFVCIKAISIEAPELFKERAEKIKIMVSNNISKACDELVLSREVRRIAFKISNIYEGKLGFKSRIIAASAVSIAVRIVSIGNRVSILQISDCLEITASTVYCHIKNVRIDVLKRKYQDYLYNLENPIHSFIPKENIQDKMKSLDTEIIIEETSPLASVDTQVPIPVIPFEKKSNNIKKNRTSQFITNNQELFSRFISNSMQLRSFGAKFKENDTIGVLKNIGLSSGVSGFTEFEFSPPIS